MRPGNSDGKDSKFFAIIQQYRITNKLKYVDLDFFRLIGAFITTAVQCSTATTVMTVSSVNAGQA